MSSISSSLEKGKAPYQAPLFSHFPEELLSLIIDRMDLSSHQNMGCASKGWRELIVGETKKHLEQRALGFVTFVEEWANQEAKKLKSELWETIPEEWGKIEELLTHIEKNKELLQKPGQLDAWLLDVYNDLRQSGLSDLSGKIRERVVSLEQEDKGPAKMLASLTDLLRERDQAITERGMQVKEAYTQLVEAIPLIAKAEITLNSEYNAEQNLFSDMKISSKIEDEGIISLTDALATLPAHLRNAMSNDYYAPRFIRKLKARLQPEVVAPIERELNLARDSQKTTLVVISEMRESHQLDPLLIRSEIDQFRDIDHFESEKNSWVKRLIMASTTEEQRVELRKLLSNPAIQNSETLFEAIEKTPLLVTFLAGYVLKKIEMEIREEAFLDIPSILTGALDPSNREMVNAISTKTIERNSRPGAKGSETWRRIDLGPVILNLSAYNLTDKWLGIIRSRLSQEEIKDINFSMLASVINLKMVDEVVALAPFTDDSQYILGMFALELLTTDIQKAFEVGEFHNARMYIQMEFNRISSMASAVQTLKGEWNARLIFEIGLELGKRGLLSESSTLTVLTALLFMLQHCSFEEAIGLLEKIPDKYREEAKQMIALLNWQTPDLQERLGTVEDVDFIKPLIACCHYKEVPGLIRQLNPIYHSECADYLYCRINLFNIPQTTRENYEFMLEIYNMIESPGDYAKRVGRLINARLARLS